jgi:hypothetical protein
MFKLQSLIYDYICFTERSSIILIKLYWNEFTTKFREVSKVGKLISKHRFRFETVPKVTNKGNWLYVCHLGAAVGIYPAHLPQYKSSPLSSRYRDS